MIKICLVGPPAGIFEFFELCLKYFLKKRKFHGLVGPPAGIFEIKT